MMIKRLKLVVLLLIAAMALNSEAAPPSPAVRAEIDALLQRLQGSGCEFGRNGDWYGGAVARAHLLKKLGYLEGKDLVHSSEDFIERAATRSSASGKPYLVRCGGPTATPQESQAWLRAELKAARAAHPASAAKH